MAIMDIASILQRIKELRNLRFDREIAQVFDLTSTDFSNRKKRGTLLPVIIEWAEKEGVDLRWLLFGNSDDIPAVCDKKPISLTLEEAEALIMLRRMEQEKRDKIMTAIRRAFIFPTQ